MLKGKGGYIMVAYALLFATTISQEEKVKKLLDHGKPVLLTEIGDGKNDVFVMPKETDDGVLLENVYGIDILVGEEETTSEETDVAHKSDIPSVPNKGQLDTFSGTDVITDKIEPSVQTLCVISGIQSLNGTGVILLLKYDEYGGHTINCSGMAWGINGQYQGVFYKVSRTGGSESIFDDLTFTPLE